MAGRPGGVGRRGRGRPGGVGQPGQQGQQPQQQQPSASKKKASRGAPGAQARLAAAGPVRLSSPAFNRALRMPIQARVRRHRPVAAVVEWAVEVEVVAVVAGGGGGGAGGGGGGGWRWRCRDDDRPGCGQAGHPELCLHGPAVHAASAQGAGGSAGAGQEAGRPEYDGWRWRRWRTRWWWRRWRASAAAVAAVAATRMGPMEKARLDPDHFDRGRKVRGSRRASSSVNLTASAFSDGGSSLCPEDPLGPGQGAGRAGAVDPGREQDHARGNTRTASIPRTSSSSAST